MIFCWPVTSYAIAEAGRERERRERVGRVGDPVSTQEETVRRAAGSRDEVPIADDVFGTEELPGAPDSSPDGWPPGMR